MEMATNLKVVFCSFEGRNYQNPLVDLCHDGLTLSGTHLRRVRDVDMKRDFAFVVCTFLLYYSLAHRLYSFGFICLGYILSIIYRYHLLLRFSSTFGHRNLATLEMRMMRDTA